MKTTALNGLPDLQQIDVPPSVLAVPSMMSVAERQFLFRAISQLYQGDGLIVDAGVFCGASTVIFGEGLRANPLQETILRRFDNPIQTYELGIVDQGMIRFFERHNIVGDWALGGSFVEYLERNIASVRDLVSLQVGDISKVTWSGQPIEVLFLDVLKSEEIQRNVIRSFYPSLLPGALLIHQDYFFDGLPFLKITQESLADHFEYIGEIASTAVFRLVKAIPENIVLIDPNDALPREIKARLLDQARDRSIDIERRLMCDLSKIGWISETDSGQARAMLAALPGLYPDQFGDRMKLRLSRALEDVEKIIGENTASAV